MKGFPDLWPDCSRRLQELLGESMRMQDAPSFRTVHDSLLERCAAALKLISSSTARLTIFRRLSSSYLLDAASYHTLFTTETSRSGMDSKPSNELLKEIYHAWRRRDVVEASLAWATWLLSEGKGKEASDVVQRARVEVDGSSRQRLEDEWRHAMDESTKRPEPEASSDEDDEMDQD